MSKLTQLLKPENNKVASGIIAICLEVLRTYFAEYSEKFKFDLEPTKSKISILPSYSTKENEVGKRPAIYVRRGPTQYNELAMGHNFGETHEDGSTQHIITQQGFVTCYCTSKIPVETELLAAETAEILNDFCLIIANDFNFLKVKLESVGEIGTLEEDKTVYAVPVTLSYAAAKAWSIYYESTKIRRFRVMLNELLVAPKNQPDVDLETPIGVEVAEETGPENEIYLTYPGLNETN